MSLQRRKFILLSATTTATLASSSMLLKAADSINLLDLREDFKSEISTNHGHALSLSTMEIVQLLRQADQSPTDEVTIDIQGDSSHPHLLVLSTNELNNILLGEEISKPSSADFGHAHDVTLSLTIIET